MNDHRYRRQANDVIRQTVSRIREEQRRIEQMERDGHDYAEREEALAELKYALEAMLLLRKTRGGRPN
jgi:hypothetical protein